MSERITDDATDLPPPAPAKAAPPAPPGWEGILDPGERILWQGKPVRGIDGDDFNPMRSAMGVLMTGFAIFWLTKLNTMPDMKDGAPIKAFMSLFGLFFVAMGINTAGGYMIGNALKRARTHYTLTDRRAFIASSTLWGKKSLKSYAIGPKTPLEYDGAEPGTILFARETRQSSKGRHYTVTAGFRRIADSRAVYRKIRDVQTGEMTR
ncbi:aspartate carbamoyltransferase catalytic subunit [Rhodalgimonas zhirmunskyi]|uniref:Aspartate carbamoyltransferase catalytic subunit n=1 Tax=Rhodalgimonas zhirmunskyi TaxID=2964767 RepID=A0AAJ1X6T9_9RHOB|nr:aspartate carbamoyltransferase catalytic subunit [Rhodoalgimonas zhirmunskyi]MDQ2093832.1 aspartate carbamoyltransferase catalytic subunit [Rhodoalgimonas zhirmunskyi]